MIFKDNFVDRDDSSISIALLDDRGLNILYTKSTDDAKNTASVMVNDNDAPPVIMASRTETDSISEAESADIEFTIVVDDMNTTTMSAEDIDIRVGIMEEDVNFFDSDTQIVKLLAGETSVSGVEPNDDTVDEADGSFTAMLIEDETRSTGAHYNVASDSDEITVDVTDDDAAPIIEVVRNPNRTINEGGDATYTLRIAPFGDNKTTASDQDIEVAVELSDSVGDYINNDATSVSATISAGDSSADLVVSTLNNTMAEGHGSITVEIQADDGETSDGRYLVSTNYDSVTTNVNDNDLSGETAILTFAKATEEVEETEADGMVDLVVELEGDPSADITVTFATQVISRGLGFATADEDFTAPVTGSDIVTFTFSATDPVTEQTIQIPIPADLIDEPAETFKVVLMSPTGAPISSDAGGNEMMITIVDDDAPPVIQVSSSASSLDEGSSATLTYSIFTDAENTTTASARDIEIQVLLSEENGRYFERTRDQSVAIPVILKAGQTSVDEVVDVPDNTIDESSGQSPRQFKLMLIHMIQLTILWILIIMK